MIPLADKVVGLHRALARSKVPHAFGGALALAYYAEPRATVDIDVNLFVGTDRYESVARPLRRLGATVDDGRVDNVVQRDGQVRVFWERTPLDLFFAYDPLHESCLARLRRVPFGEGAAIPILSGEDLVVFKALFDRPKDWSDIAEVLYARGPGFDAGYTLRWLRRILAADDARLRRIERLLHAPAG